LGEQGAPRWAGTTSIGWASGTFGMTLRSQYIGEQAVAGAIQIKDLVSELGPAGMAKAMWVHSLSARYEYKSGLEFFGGVNNLSNEEPPRSPRGNRKNRSRGPSTCAVVLR